MIALCARGLTVGEIQEFLSEMYGVEVSPDHISTVTDAVLAEVTAWQARPLEPRYPVVFFDALRVKIRDEAVVRSKAVYLALAVLPDGTRDVLGIWIERTEGAKFWMKLFTDLKARGCQDILIAVTHGLKGRSEALAAVYRRRRCRPASCTLPLATLGNSCLCRGGHRGRDGEDAQPRGLPRAGLGTTEGHLHLSFKLEAAGLLAVDPDGSARLMTETDE